MRGKSATADTLRGGKDGCRTARGKEMAIVSAFPTTTAEDEKGDTKKERLKSPGS